MVMQVESAWGLHAVPRLSQDHHHWECKERSCAVRYAWIPCQRHPCRPQFTWYALFWLLILNPASVYVLCVDLRIWSQCYSIPSSLSIPLGSGLMGSQSLYCSDVPRTHTAVPSGNREWSSWEPATLGPHLCCEGHLGVGLLSPVANVQGLIICAKKYAFFICRFLFLFIYILS